MSSMVLKKQTSVAGPGTRYLRDANPSEWLNGAGGDGAGHTGPNGYGGFGNSYGGACFDLKTRTAWVPAQGGHSVTYNNGIFFNQFLPSGITGWQLFDISPLSASLPDSALVNNSYGDGNHFYADGRIPSSHFNGCAIGNGKIWVCSGNTNPNGNSTMLLYSIDLTTKVHRCWGGAHSPNGYPTSGWDMFYDDATKCIVLMDFDYDGQIRYGIFDTRLLAWRIRNQYTNTGVQTIDGQSLAYDTRRHRALVVGPSHRAPVTPATQIDWDGRQSVTSTIITPTPGYEAILNASGPALAYCHEWDRYICMALDWGSTGQFATLLEIHPETYAITPHTWAGDAIVPHTGTAGVVDTANRAHGCLWPLWGWNAVALCNCNVDDVYVGSLP
jgi:hypothetical protein